MAMIRRRRFPQFAAPQPDRDFAPGARPTDVMNRNPGSLGALGQMSGGAASMFRPRQGQIRNQMMQRKTPTSSHQLPGAVKISFSGDPAQLAQTFQALINNTGTGADPRQTPNPDANPEGTIGNGGVAGGPGTPVSPLPIPGAPLPLPGTPTQTSTGLPQVATPPPDFGSLQGYIDAIGGLDLITEDAYKPYADWQPRLPHMMQAKNALDQQFLSSIGAAGVNQEVAKAFTQAALARAVQDEVLDQERNREAMNERGMFNSGITGRNAGLIQKDYLRSAEDTYADLFSQLTGQASGLQSGFGSYLDKIIGLANEEAGILVDTPGAGATPVPEPPASGGGGRERNPDASKPWGFFGYTWKQWQALPEKKRNNLKARFRKRGN